MKKHPIQSQSKTRQRLLPLALGLTLLGSADAARADDLLVNTFDADPISGIPWQNWRGYVLGHELLWDGTQDADGNTGSGSMHTKVDWPTTDHPTFSSGWNDVQVALSTGAAAVYDNYLTVEAMVKVDVTNSFTAINGKYGRIEFICNGGTGNWSGAGGVTLEVTNGWQRISRPMPAKGTNTFDSVVLMFVSDGGDVMTNTVHYWIDNVKLVGPPSVNTNRPALSMAKAPPAGLTCMATAPGDAWQRQMVRTVNTGYSWHTANAASNTTTYAITVGAIPNNGFEAIVYLIPENGMAGGGTPNPDATSVDWDSANVVYFTINANANGTGKGNFRYKTNSAGAENFQSWTDHVTTNGAVGTWKLSFVDNTNVTITAPDNTSTSLTIPDEAAALFGGNLNAYVGDRPAAEARIGQSATFSRIKITGAAAEIDDTFVVLNPATWAKKAVSPAGVFITATDAKYWVSWPLPDSGYTNLYATDSLNKNLAGGQWASLPAADTGWLNVAGDSRLTVVNQSALNTAFSYTPSNCFFQLFHP